MAHFEKYEKNLNKHYSIGDNEQVIPIRVGKNPQTILLWGGDSDGSPLIVTSSDPTVLQVKEADSLIKAPNYRAFQVTALRDADKAKLYVHSKNAPSGMPWDEVTFLILDKTEKAGDFLGNNIIHLATSLLGSHYVWGAAGAKPDIPCGMPSRPGLVGLLKKGKQKDDLIDSVAYTDIEGRNTCAGNSWINGRTGYISSSNGLDQNTQNKTYRTVYFKGVKKGILLGEKCENVRHFDCVGFVNYCLSKVLGKIVHDSIPGYAKHCIPIGNRNEYKKGDIVTYGNHHIAFIYDDNATRVINAADTQYGVKISDFNVSERSDTNKNKVVRHPDLY